MQASIEKLQSNLSPLADELRCSEGREQAAVLVTILDDGIEPSVLYTRRADHLRSHAGHVSFPGGRRDNLDRGLSNTALRESQEEVGLNSSSVVLLGCLTPRISINGLDVLPYVGMVSEEVEWVTNPEEIADIFTVPLSFFESGKPDYLESYEYKGKRVHMPSWQYERFNIWGLTAAFTLDLLERWNMKIDFDGIEVRTRD